jgi:hypothetical protein
VAVNAHRVGANAIRREEADRTQAATIGELLTLATIILAGVGIPVVFAFVTGAIDLPRNDDWAFSRAALRLFRTGQVELSGWAVMSLVGHLLWAQPWLEILGPTQRTLHLAQATAAAGGLACTYLVGRAFVSPRRSLLLTALVATLPGFAIAATGFMTDTTAFASQMACLAAGLLALRAEGRRYWGWLVISLLLGLLAFSIREVAAAALGAVLLTHLTAAARRGDQGRKVALLGAGVVCVLIFAAFLLWRPTIAGSRSLVVRRPGLDNLAQVAQSYFTLCFACAPVLLLVRWRTVWERLGIRSLRLAAGVGMSLVLATGAFLLLGRTVSASGVFVGNALTRIGSLANIVMLGDRGALFPAPMWTTMTAVALMAGLAFVPVALAFAWPPVHRRSLRRLRETDADTMLGAFLLLSTLGALSYGAVGGNVFDRYLWMPALAIALVLMNATQGLHASLIPASFAVALFGIVALGLTADQYAFDAARWEAGQLAVDEGYAAEDIDAGFEWVGYHSDGVAGSRSPPAIRGPHRWYLEVFLGVRNCVIVSASPRGERALRPLATHALGVPLLRGNRRLYVYRNEAACPELR